MGCEMAQGHEALNRKVRKEREERRVQFETKRSICLTH